MAKNLPGFTLIELLVVISIGAILFSLGFASYQTYNRSQLFESAVADLRGDLRLAQTKALAGEKRTSCTEALSGWCLKFSGSSYTLVLQCGNEIIEKTMDLSGRKITIVDPPLQPVCFRPLGLGVYFGEDVSSKAITLSGLGKTKTITITAVGGIE